MGIIKRIVGLVAMAAVLQFAPQFAPAIGQFFGVSGFLGAAIGGAVIAAGLTAIQSILGGGGRQAPDMDAGKVNVRIPEPPRWLCAGRVRQGGGVLFAEFAPNGDLWYLVVHSDSILTGPPSYFLDDVPVTLDGSGYVNQADFRLLNNKDKDPATSDGQGEGYIQIWTTTYSESNPTPPRITALDSAFPSLWTSDHRLVGTTFSVVRIRSIEIENRHKIFRWRGPLNMGDPAISIVGDWSNVYDPRDPTQTLGNRATYKPSRNAALVWAWFRTHPYGRNKPESSINWDRIAEQADICDQQVVGLQGTQPRYQCGASIVDSKRRVDAEIEIMLTMDGQIVFDEDGRTWCRAGHWETPTLSFSRNRDIMAMESVEAQDGESETHGVIVRYTDPDANYTVQPSAAWLNPIYYDPLTSPNFLVVDILGCHNHNQAMRLAKGIGMRSQPLHKIGPTVNLRGLRARQERIVAINYDDNVFTGDYEIAVPVELDGAGIFTGFGAVPIDQNRWTLLPGEESPKPVVDVSTAGEAYPPIVGETVAVVDNAIQIDFPAKPRPDASYVAEYIRTSEITGSENDPWIPMAININTAVSGAVVEGVSYTVRYRYVTGSGRGPAWEYDVVTPGFTIMPVTNLSLDVSTPGQAGLTWRNPNDLNFAYTSGYRNTVNDFGTATEIFTGYAGGVGQVQSVTDTVSAGTYYWWIVAHTSDGTPSSPTGPVSGAVT